MRAGHARVLPLLGLVALALAAWLTLGIHRGVVASLDVKAWCWPWGGQMERQEPQAPALSDPVWQFLPWISLARRQIASGEMPLWNPHQDGGVPLLGNSVSALGSPLLLPALLLGPADGWNLSLLARLLAAAAGAFVLQRVLGRSRLAGALAAVAFALSGPFIAWLEHPHTLAVAFVPFLLAGIERLREGASRGAVVAIALTTAAVLAGGHPETALMAAMLAVAWLLVRAPRAWLAGPLAALLGALLAAPLLLPFAEYFLLSEAREGAGRAPIVMPVAALIRFVSPGAAVGHPIEAAATVSIAVLAIAAAGAVLAWRGGEARFWLVAGSVMLLLAYDGPVARLAASATPVYWSRALLLVPLAFGSLAAIGVDRLRARLGPRTGTVVAAIALLIAGGELLAAARGVHAVTPEHLLDPRTPVLDLLAAEREPFRVLPLHTYLPPNSASVLGLDEVRGYDAIAPAGWRRQRRSIGRFGSTHTVSDTLWPEDLEHGGSALDYWSVRYLLVHPQLPFDAAWFARERGLDLESVYDGPDGRLLRNRRALARARLEGEGSVVVESRRASLWRLRTSASSATTLLLADPFFPGWRARVDGQAVALRLAPGEPIRVPVPAGEHRVTVSYRPRSFTAGVVLAALGIVALPLAVRRLPRRSRRGGSPLATYPTEVSGL